MKNEKGITLVMVIITVLMLAIIAGLAVNSGIDVYKNSKVTKFETYMKILQKKVDVIIEEKIDYTTLGSSLTSEQKTMLTTITENAFVETSADEIDSADLRYFSSSDIEEVFDIRDVQDDIVINFSNREVISLNGVEKDGVMHYVELGLH